MSMKIDRNITAPSVDFGPMAAPLAEQLEGRGLSADDLEHWQADLLAINRLYIRGLMAPSTRRDASHRLWRDIVAGMRRTAKEP